MSPHCDRDTLSLFALPLHQEKQEEDEDEEICTTLMAGLEDMAAGLSVLRRAGVLRGASVLRRVSVLMRTSDPRLSPVLSSRRRIE